MGHDLALLGLRLSEGKVSQLEDDAQGDGDYNNRAQDERDLLSLLASGLSLDLDGPLITVGDVSVETDGQDQVIHELTYSDRPAEATWHYLEH